MNEGNSLAKLGDLIVESSSGFENAKDKLKEKIRASDPDRELIIRDIKPRAGYIRFVCKGNGNAIGFRCKNKTAEIDCLASSIHTYLFKGVCIGNVLTPNQLEQVSVIAIDQTNFFFWIHFGRITGYNAHKAKTLSCDFLKRLKEHCNLGELFDAMVEQGS